MGSEDRIQLIQTIRAPGSSGSNWGMGRRSRSGILVLSAFCFVILTILFYLCRMDYQTLAVEKQLLRFHESVIKDQIQQQLEMQLMHDENEKKDKEKLIQDPESDSDIRDLIEDSESKDDDQRQKSLNPGVGDGGPETGHQSNQTAIAPAAATTATNGDVNSSAESDYEARVRQMFDHENNVSPFDIHKQDVIVFLQMQNTGSSLLEQRIIKDLVLDKACSCVKNRCPCLRPDTAVTPATSGSRSHKLTGGWDENESRELSERRDEDTGHDSYWLFSRKTVGWSCGFHADWTEMTHCVDPALDQIEGRTAKRRYFFMTQLRDPVKRFLSEFYRWTRAPITSGLNTVHTCRGKEVQVTDQCNLTTSATLQEWISCPYNLALNRQTRMLADLSLVDCYNYSSLSRADRNLILLNSAKANLHNMAFFAMAEYPKVSMKLFQYTFGLMFTPSLMDQIQDLKWSGKRIKGHTGRELPLELVELIREANKLDIELYDYAKSLLFDRFNRMEAEQNGLSFSAGKVIQRPVDQNDDDGNDGEDDGDAVVLPQKKKMRSSKKHKSRSKAQANSGSDGEDEDGEEDEEADDEEDEETST